MDKKVSYIGVHGKNCMGCQNNNRDIMICLQDERDLKNMIFNDWFLTQEQAEQLYKQLGEQINRNKSCN